MSFTVEDGNGLAAANSYVSVQEFKDFADYRVGVTLPEDDKTIERALVTASSWIDSNFAARFKGTASFAVQALAWPRYGIPLSDGLASPLNYIPLALKKAVCILAIEACKGDPLYKNADGAARIITEDSIGPLITKYAPQSPNAVTQERQFPEVQATLNPLLRSWGTLQIERA